MTGSGIFQALGRAVQRIRTQLKEHLLERQITFAQLSYRAIRFVLTKHEILSRASAIAYCAMLAFIPFVALVITVGAHLLPDLGKTTGVVTTSGITPQDVAAVMQKVFPPDVASLIMDQIAAIQTTPPLAVILGTLFIALWTSSGLYSEIINSLNRILGVSESRSYWRLQLTSLILVTLQTVVLSVAFVTIVGWPTIMSLLSLSGSMAGLATVLQWIVLFGVIYLSFAILFHYGPATTTGKREHWVSPGALFGTIIFLVATLCFRFYLEHFARYRSAYGSLGGVMMLMVWLWLMSLVMLIAAEINKLASLTDLSKPENKLPPASGTGSALPPPLPPADTQAAAPTNIDAPTDAARQQPTNPEAAQDQPQDPPK